MSIVNLFGGIIAAFNKSPLRRSCRGLFYGRVFDRTVAPPYVTYTLVNGLIDDDMSSCVEDVVLQFSVWSIERSPDEVISLAESLWDVFDNIAFEVMGFKIIRFDRLSYNLLPDPDSEGWQMQTDYRIILQEQ